MIPTSAFDAERLLAGIQEWVAVESPTFDRAAVNRMLDLAGRRIGGLGAAVERLPGRDGYGDMLRCRLAGKSDGPGVLIIAHVDTVHPAGTLAGYLPMRRDGDRAFGPGIYDMKGGTFVALAALEAVIAAHGRPPLPVTLIINPDEEIGSPTSRELIEAEARHHRYVLLPEPANGEDGAVTTGRHAFQRFWLTAHGKPAHSGWTNRDGRSAIRVMAQIVEELEAGSNLETGPTYAVGVIEGGQWVNCIPKRCRAQALCVSKDEATFSEIGRVMAGLVGERAGVRIELEPGPVRPLWRAGAATLALYDKARAIAADLGFGLPHGQFGGGSDGNFTGAMGVATLDGLGVIGGGAHTEEEYLLVSSLVPRATLFARLLEGLG